MQRDFNERRTRLNFPTRNLSTTSLILNISEQRQNPANLNQKTMLSGAVEMFTVCICSTSFSRQTEFSRLIRPVSFCWPVQCYLMLPLKPWMDTRQQAKDTCQMLCQNLLLSYAFLMGCYWQRDSSVCIYIQGTRYRSIYHCTDLWCSCALKLPNKLIMRPHWRATS